MKTFAWMFETGGEIEVPDGTTEAEAEEIIKKELAKSLVEGLESLIVWEK